MVAVLSSVAVVGVVGHRCTVEVGISDGLPTFTIVGLPDTAVREARERVRSAIGAAELPFPKGRITVNLAPADLPKTGTWFDLPIALGILLADGRLELGSAPLVRRAFVVGELGLDGTVRPVPGVLSAALCARTHGCDTVVVPPANADEAAAVPGLQVEAPERLVDFTRVLEPRTARPAPRDPSPVDVPDMGDIAGQATAKFAMQVAAAGAHHCLLVGEPGAGKTTLARRLPSLLPPLDDEQVIEVSLVHSVAGASSGLVTTPPFRAPHHTASATSVIGGGSAAVSPGEVTLASHGVLFLDEFGEFRPHVLDALRQPLEDRTVRIARRSLRVELPAGFQLVAAMNPCPCGFAGSQRRPCRCDPFALTRYRRRLSGPLLDRIDLTVPVTPVDADVLVAHTPTAQSPVLRAEVVAARERQDARNGSGRTNAVLSAREMTGWPVTTDARRAVAALGRVLSSRGLLGVQRVARTLADLAGDDVVDAGHVDAAAGLRGPDTVDVDAFIPGVRGRHLGGVA